LLAGSVVDAIKACNRAYGLQSFLSYFGGTSWTLPGLTSFLRIVR